MSRLNDIVNEDCEVFKDGLKKNDNVIALKLTQISATLAMIYDLERERYHRECSDDGR